MDACTLRKESPPTDTVSGIIGLRGRCRDDDGRGGSPGVVPNEGAASGGGSGGKWRRGTRGGGASASTDGESGGEAGGEWKSFHFSLIISAILDVLDI